MGDRPEPGAVPMKDYVDLGRKGALLIGAVAAFGFAAVIMTLDKKNAKAVELALEGQEEATRVALDAAAEKGLHHNGLIERMREMSSTYITRGNLYSALIAAGVVSGIYFQFAR
jgi:hypothetical protein